jgi:hypothetical protein
VKQYITLLLLIVLSTIGFAQPGDSIKNSSWKLEGQYAVGKNEVWSTDILGNVYLTDRKVIQKYDSIGRLKFSQSVKSFGKVAEIRPVNTMKLVLFSEDQQILCWMDNTLTLGEECIDLSKFEIGLATHVAASGQPEKLWVVDQLNSKLLLLDLGRSNQSQEIKNLKGILNMSDIMALTEVNNELFLLDNKGVIYRFDLYGSLIERYDDFGNITGFAVKDDALMVLTDRSVAIRHLSDDHKIDFKLPVEGVKEFRVTGSFFYFRTENKILKYSPVFQ